MMKDNFMDTYWFNKLLGLLKVQSNSENEKRMVLYLDKELRKLKLPYSIDAAGNLIVTKGKASTYPCVVSHMDTVHSIVDNFKVFTDINDKDILFAKNGKQTAGVGGDDKCGIFGCLYLLEVIPEIKVVFFSREERSCKGSKEINKKFFVDCRYLIQLDRRGSRDFIQTFWGKKTISHEFSSEIGIVKKKYKYKNTVGTITDVMSLWDNKVGISCINLSCGYYNPHTKNEYISIEDLWHSIQFTREIINTMQPKRYVSLPPKLTTMQTTTNTTTTYNKCSKCGKWKEDFALYKIWNRIDHIYEQACWTCSMDTSKSTDREIAVFACYECGIKTDEMKKGDTLKYRGNRRHLYCDKCSELFSTPRMKKGSLVTCEICEDIILENHYRTVIEGVLVCGVCACDLREPTHKSCWICNKIIPKNSKTFSRFGKLICEVCSVPSDITFVG